METVIKPCLNPLPRQAADRVRHAIAERRATVRAVGAHRRRTPKGGRPRKWGKRLPSPQEHDEVERALAARPSLCLRPHSHVSLQVPAMLLVGQWPQQIMCAFVFEVPGYDKLWATITSAGDLSAAQVAFGQRRTVPAGRRISRPQATAGDGRMPGVDQGTRVADVPSADGGADAAAADAVPPDSLAATPGVAPPPWNLGKRHVSILDLRRLFWKHRPRFSQVMAAWTTCKNLPKPNSTAASPPAVPHKVLETTVSGCGCGLAEHASRRNEAAVLYGDDAERGPPVWNVGHRFCDRRTDRGAHRVYCEAGTTGLGVRRKGPPHFTTRNCSGRR